MSFKASKYTIWMNYDNDKKQYQVPMNPESIQIKIDGKAVTSDIDRLGTLLHKGKRGPMQISWSSYFPATYGNYCTCQKKNFKTPQTMHKSTAFSLFWGIQLEHICCDNQLYRYGRGW